MQQQQNTQLALGEKIRNFRKRAGLSQLELETEIDASQGSISRIESSKVTPTKETIFDIARALKLSPTETSYLLNDKYIEASSSEIEQAKQEFTRTTNGTEMAAYLLDPKGIVLAVSDKFQDLTSMLRVDATKLIGKHVIDILLDPAVGIRETIPQEKFMETVRNVLAVSKYERNYQLNEQWWQEKMTALQNYPEFVEVWKQLQTKEINPYGEAARTMYFKVGGLDLEVQFFTTALHHDPRFIYVEYKIVKDKSNKV